MQVVAHIQPEQRPLPLYPHCALWSTRAGISLSLRPDLQKGFLGPIGWTSRAYHIACIPAAVLPVSRACGTPREGSLEMDGRRYTTCTRPCSASFAASPFSRGSIKNSSSSIRIRPACRAKIRWFRFPEHNRQGGGATRRVPEGRISHLEK